MTPTPPAAQIEITPAAKIGYLALLRVLFAQYPGRSVLGAALMITQSFLYNAIFFTYGLVLEFFFHVSTNALTKVCDNVRVADLQRQKRIGSMFDEFRTVDRGDQPAELDPGILAQHVQSPGAVFPAAP